MVQSQRKSLVTVNAADLSAFLSPESTWQDVVYAAAPHGLVAIHAFDQRLNAVESALANDFSPYSRLLGSSADSVRSSGTATELAAGLEIDLFPMDGGYSGYTYWQASEAATVVPLWLAWAQTAPHIATTRLSIVTLAGRDAASPRALLRIDGLVAVRRSTEALDAFGVLNGLLGPLVAATKPMSSRWTRTTNRLRQVNSETDKAYPCAPMRLVQELATSDLLDWISDAVRTRRGFRLNQQGGQMSVGRLSGRPGTHPSAAFELISSGGSLLV